MNSVKAYMFNLFQVKKLGNVLIAFFIPYSLFLIPYSVSAQELFAQVTVNTSQIQESNKSVFETLQNQLREFINNKKWTGDQFLNQERIECTIFINVTERVSTDQFKATLTVQSRRPVFNSSYNSPMINYQD